MTQHKDYALEESYAPPQSTFFWAKGFRDGDTVDVVFQDDRDDSAVSRRIGRFFLISGFDAEDAHKEGQLISKFDLK